MKLNCRDELCKKIYEYLTNLAGLEKLITFYKSLSMDNISGLTVIQQAQLLKITQY